MKDYRTSDATTEPMDAPGAITAAPPERVKGRTIKQIELMNTIRDLQQELVDAHNYRDSQEEKIAVQEERLTALRTEIISLKETITLNANFDAKALERKSREIRALKTLVKLYLS